MSGHDAPSPPTAAAESAAAGGAQRKRKRQKVLDTVSVTLKTEEIVEEPTDEMSIFREKCRWFITMLLSTSKISMINILNNK